MDRLLSVNCTKYNSHKLISLILVLGSIVLIMLALNFILKDSPMEQFNVYLMISLVIIISFAVFLIISKRHKLEISIDNNENQHLTILYRGQKILLLKPPLHVEAFFTVVQTGGGPRTKMNELYLIFKENDKIKLTLRHSYGTLYEVPSNFIEKIPGSFEFQNEFSCGEIEKVERLINYKKNKK